MDNSTVEGRITVMLAEVVYASHVALSTLHIVCVCFVCFSVVCKDDQSETFYCRSGTKRDMRSGMYIQNPRNF